MDNHKSVWFSFIHEVRIHKVFEDCRIALLHTSRVRAVRCHAVSNVGLVNLRVGRLYVHCKVDRWREKRWSVLRNSLNVNVSSSDERSCSGMPCTRQWQDRWCPWKYPWHKLEERTKFITTGEYYFIYFYLSLSSGNHHFSSLDERWCNATSYIFWHRSRKYHPCTSSLQILDGGEKKLGPTISLTCSRTSSCRFSSADER